MTDTRFVARCGFCNRGISRVYRAEVVLEDHQWYCNARHHNLKRAGYTYRPWWKLW